MSGTKAGWAKRRKTMQYDDEGKSIYHKTIGSKGGKNKGAHKRAFALDPELAKRAAKKSAEVRRQRAENKAR